MPRLLDHALTSARNPASGRLDARRLGAFLGIGVADFARILRRDPSGLRRRPDGDALQGPMNDIERLAVRVRALTGSEDYARMWFHAPHPALGHQTPLRILEDGRAPDLHRLLDAVERDLEQGPCA